MEHVYIILVVPVLCHILYKGLLGIFVLCMNNVPKMLLPSTFLQIPITASLCFCVCHLVSIRIHAY
jgi:hypothetical protein